MILLRDVVKEILQKIFGEEMGGWGDPDPLVKKIQADRLLNLWDSRPENEGECILVFLLSLSFALVSDVLPRISICVLGRFHHDSLVLFKSCPSTVTRVSYVFPRVSYVFLSVP